MEIFHEIRYYVPFQPSDEQVNSVKENTMVARTTYKEKKRKIAFSCA